MVRLANIWYFFFLIVAGGSIVGLYYLFRNKSLKAKKILIAVLLFFNLALHFLRLLMPPYNTDPNFAMESGWFINICGVSVLTFPFIFLSKSDTAKDWMFYIGVISGFLSLVYPTEALNRSLLEIDLWRFYVCHMIIFIAPLLMVLLKVHSLNYRNVWKMPFCMMAVMLFIMCNQVLQAELGIISLRGDDLLKEACGYRNTSLIWGPSDGLAAVFTWLTPDFMKTVPWGDMAGEPKYWPFFYLLPGVFFYFIIIPLLLSVIWEHRHIKEDFNKVKSWFQNRKRTRDTDIIK